MLKEYNLTANDWIFIGDGNNDEHIAQKAPISIGMNPAEKLRKVTNYNVDNFYDIIKYL
jgi:hydroxymethylpyrimidine pyrophosphatase-like HAD family hydrolase